MNRLILILAIGAGCAGLPPPPPTVSLGERRVEERPLPPDPKTEKLTGQGDMAEWAIAQRSGQCTDSKEKTEPIVGPCPKLSGILLSEGKAARYSLLDLRYRELRANYTADQEVWKVHRQLYEERLKLANKAIYDLQPGWWDRHKLEIGVGGGFVLGIAVSVAIVALIK
jgi:hypothetical protein